MQETQSTKQAVSVVIPCFNEEAALPPLAEKLRALQAISDYDLHFLFVDDGSTDRTWQVLQQYFAGQQSSTLLRHPTNQGISAAILAGIRAAQTEVICSIDCDSSYDPSQLESFVPLLAPGIDLVTASPYHPAGTVSEVPALRLFLSRSASLLYRVVLRRKLHSYTSCFRVYRRSAILKLDLRHPGFLGVAELLGKLDLQGGMIVECPAHLRSRIHGASKIKIARVLVGHLFLLCELMAMRIRQAFSGNPRSELAT